MLTPTIMTLEHAHFFDAAGQLQGPTNILIEDGIIKAIGTIREGVVFDASPYWIAPGLINAHTHVALSFLRGMAHDTPQMIENLFFRAESHLNANLVESLSLAYLYEGLRSGVTSFADHYYFSDAVAKAMDRLGVRGMVGECVADLGGAFPDRERWDLARHSIENWKHSSRITPVVAPHAADTVSRQLLKDMSAFAKAQQLPLHMHLSQTRGERDRVARREKCSPVVFADQCGALGEKSLLVHLVSADSRDLKIIADRGSSIGFCPASQIIYEKLAPISEFLRLKLPLLLATDCAPSNDSCDLYAELRLSSLLCKHFHCEGFDLPQLWSSVTSTPARFFNLASGVIAEGKSADLVFMRCDTLMEPRAHPLSDLIFASLSKNIEHVMIDGRWVLKDRDLVNMTEGDLREEFSQAVTTIHSLAGISR